MAFPYLQCSLFYLLPMTSSLTKQLQKVQALHFKLMLLYALLGFNLVSLDCGLWTKAAAILAFFY